MTISRILTSIAVTVFIAGCGKQDTCVDNSGQWDAERNQCYCDYEELIAYGFKRGDGISEDDFQRCIDDYQEKVKS